MERTTISGVSFWHQESSKQDVHTKVTGKNLYHNFTFNELPKAKAELMEQQGIISIESLAREKMLKDDPDIFNLNYYGTYRKGVWAALRQQMQSTLFWALNRQPNAFTMFVDNIYDPQVQQIIKTAIQDGIHVNVCVVPTGYMCKIPPVCNRKKSLVFSREFLCEVYRAQFEAGTLTDDRVLNKISDVYEKCQVLSDYRKYLQDKIWKNVNYALEYYAEDWKCEAIYARNSRVQFAVRKQTEGILSKYAQDMNIGKDNAITVDDVTDETYYRQMIDLLDKYGRAFGIDEVNTREFQHTVTTYTPKEWLRADDYEITTSILVKQAYNRQAEYGQAYLSEIVQAYLQLDWYMSQPEPELYYANDYFKCKECGNPIHLHTTHYMNEETGVLYDLNKEAKYGFKYDGYNNSNAIPVSQCPTCGTLHDDEGFIPDEFLIYDTNDDEGVRKLVRRLLRASFLYRSWEQSQLLFFWDRNLQGDFFYLSLICLAKYQIFVILRSFLSIFCHLGCYILQFFPNIIIHH